VEWRRSVERAQNNTIGLGNVIAHHAYDGVEVLNSGTTGSVITQYTIFDNIYGIHLFGGANGGIEPPTVASITLEITGTACALCTVKLFGKGDDDGEGEACMGSTGADGSGDSALTLASYPGTHFLTATTTDPISGTSECSAYLETGLSWVLLPMVSRGSLSGLRTTASASPVAWHWEAPRAGSPSVPGMPGRRLRSTGSPPQSCDCRRPQEAPGLSHPPLCCASPADQGRLDSLGRPLRCAPGFPSVTRRGGDRKAWGRAGQSPPGPLVPQRMHGPHPGGAPGRAEAGRDACPLRHRQRRHQQFGACGPSWKLPASRKISAGRISVARPVQARNPRSGGAGIRLACERV
jgi:hypothetical protein